MVVANACNAQIVAAELAERAAGFDVDGPRRPPTPTR